MIQDNQNRKVIPNSKTWLEEMDKKSRKESEYFSFSTDYLKHKQLTKTEEKSKWNKILDKVLIPIVVTLVAAGIAKYLGWV